MSKYNNGEIYNGNKREIKVQYHFTFRPIFKVTFKMKLKMKLMVATKDLKSLVYIIFKYWAVSKI